MRKTSATRATKPAEIRTFKELGQLVGKDTGTVSRWAKRDDWTFNRVPPWKASAVPAMKRWSVDALRYSVGNEEAEAEAEICSLLRNTERRARVRLLIEQTARVTLQRELMAGVWMKKEDVDRDRLVRVYRTRAALIEIPMRASLIVNKSEAEIERILSEWMDEIGKAFAA